MLKVESNFDLKLLSEIIKSSIRETDFAGIMDGVIYVLLLNTTEEESYIPINRLKTKGISTKVVEEVMDND
ncbi:hypothetical protein [Clostridium perfringens]|uniref:hypothetical protein n=1 Tax=Clostridium perfringens TaxID=1502 RepID=UPI0032DA4298